MNKTFLLLICVALILMVGVAGTVTMTANSPAEYATQTSTNVIINWTAVSTTAATLNCTVYNKIALANNFSANVTFTAVANNSWRNTTIAHTDGDRVWWKVGCQEGGSAATQVNTSQRILDVDADYYTLKLGANAVINMTLDTGNIFASGDASFDGLRVRTQVCSGNCDAGTFGWNTTHMCMCTTANTWKTVAIS